jgi:hypothetical protein
MKLIREKAPSSIREVKLAGLNGKVLACDASIVSFLSYFLIY